MHTRCQCWWQLFHTTCIDTITDDEVHIVGLRDVGGERHVPVPPCSSGPVPEPLPVVPNAASKDDRPGALGPISEYSMAETISNSEAMSVFRSGHIRCSRRCARVDKHPGCGFAFAWLDTRICQYCGLVTESRHCSDRVCDAHKFLLLGFSGPATGVIWALQAQSGKKSPKWVQKPRSWKTSQNRLFLGLFFDFRFGLSGPPTT